MTTSSKAILALSVATFALSFTDFGGGFGHGILRPIGAVAFVVFYIVNMLAKEMANFDEDQPGAPKEERNANRNSAASGRPRRLGTAH